METCAMQWIGVLLHWVMDRWSDYPEPTGQPRESTAVGTPGANIEVTPP